MSDGPLVVDAGARGPDAYIGDAPSPIPDGGDPTAVNCGDTWCWIDPFPSGSNWMLVGHASNDLWSIGKVNLHYDGAGYSAFPVPGPVDSTVSASAAPIYAPWLIADGTLHRWDGHAFQPVDVPGVDQKDLGLETLAGDGDGDVWAFGVAGALHYDGVEWKARPTVEAVIGVHTVAADDVYGWRPGNLLHFDGKIWKVIDAAPKALPACWVSPTEFLGTGSLSLWRWSGGTFTEVSPSPDGNTLSGGACTSASDVYASSEIETFHYDGSKWTPLTSAGLPKTAGTFLEFAAGDVYFQAENQLDKWHWDGKSWKAITSHALSDNSTGMGGTSPTDLWLGTYGVPEVHHYDGSQWRTDRLFEPIDQLRSDLVSAVVAFAPNNVVAIGAHRTGDGGAAYHLFVATFDGSWHRQDVPDIVTLGPIDNVAGIAPDDIWAGGAFGSVHFDGKTWQSAGPGFTSIFAIAKDDIWITQGGKPLHFDGKDWTPGAAPADTDVRRIAGRGTSDVWAVGPSGLLHYDGHAWGAAASLLLDFPSAVAVLPSGTVWIFNGTGVTNTAVRYPAGPSSGELVEIPELVQFPFVTPDGSLFSPQVGSLLVGHLD